MRLMVILLTTMMFSACGWQLRGEQVVPLSIGPVFLSSINSNNEIVIELKRALDMYGVEVTKNKSAANFTIVITDFRQSTRIATLNPSARVAEYQLNEEIDFFITNAKGTELISLSTASVERVFEFSEQDILASSNEERLVRSKMREGIVRQILGQLHALPGQ